jgi:DNA-binding transcriptional ArsR family regulator
LPKIAPPRPLRHGADVADDELDGIWKALSDSTRRAILDLLRKGPGTTTQIVEAFPHLSRFGVMKHIDVLREANLIHTREESRQRINSLNVVPIRQIYERWVGRFEELWASHLLRIKEDAETKTSARMKGEMTWQPARKETPRKRLSR